MATPDTVSTTSREGQDPVLEGLAESCDWLGPAPLAQNPSRTASRGVADTLRDVVLAMTAFPEPWLSHVTGFSQVLALRTPSGRHQTPLATHTTQQNPSFPL